MIDISASSRFSALGSSGGDSALRFWLALGGSGAGGCAAVVGAEELDAEADCCVGPTVGSWSGSREPSSVACGALRFWPLMFRIVLLRILLAGLSAVSVGWMGGGSVPGLLGSAGYGLISISSSG